MPNTEEYRRTRRIVDLLVRIANQPRRWTRRRLAEHYEVSEQQIDKDIHLIRHGLVMPLRHCAEGYYFDRLGTLPVLSLSLSEALSLLLAARLGQQMPGVSRADLAAAIARVEALLPERLLPLVSGLARGGEGEEGRAATVRELQLAIAERARLRILYRSASRASDVEREVGSGVWSEAGRQRVEEGVWPVGGVVERVVDPYTLLPYLSSWYLVAYCHLRNEVRIFKVDRIQRMGRTGESFVYPEGFDLDAYMGHTWGLLRGEAGEPEDVEIELSVEAARWARDQEWHGSQRVEELPDGRVRIGFHIGITPEFRRWVLGFGRQVRVVKPASLAEWVREEARAVVEAAERDAVSL